MTKQGKDRYNEMFGDFWFEIPIYHFNFDNSLRFELYDKYPNEEEKILIFLKQIFNDLFKDRDIHLINDYNTELEKPLGSYGINAKLVFKFDFKMRLEEIFKDEDIFRWIDKNQKLAASIYKIKTKNFSISNLFFWIFKGGLVDYPSIVIADAKNKIFMNIYDHRGMDVVVKDKKFMKEIYLKYSNWILECNREEIEKKF